jgi:hypothetical protein
MARLDEYLTADEFRGLEEIRDGKKRTMPNHIRNRLLELGYIQDVLGRPALTDAGQMRLALGK